MLRCSVYEDILFQLPGHNTLCVQYSCVTVNDESSTCNPLLADRLVSRWTMILQDRAARLVFVTCALKRQSGVQT